MAGAPAVRQRDRGWDDANSVVVQFYDFADRFWTDDQRSLDPLFALEDELIEALEGAERRRARRP